MSEISEMKEKSAIFNSKVKEILNIMRVGPNDFHEISSKWRYFYHNYFFEFNQKMTTSKGFLFQIG